jgi:hypothetical protein
MKTKTILLAAIFALIALNTQATTWTVSNNPNSPGQFTSLQAAINNADFYDTIMVAGSATSYGNITINKPLVLVGAGYNNPYGLNASIGTINLNRANLYISASGTKIMGFIVSTIALDGRFTGGTAFTQSIDNLVIERCQIGTVKFLHQNNYTGSSFNNDTIRNCVITTSISIEQPLTSTDVPVYFNDVILHNNIFNGSRIYDNLKFSTDYSNLFIRNNLFINRVSNCLVKINNTIVENNVFYGSEPHGCTGAVYSNNLTFMCFNNNIPGSGNLGSGNIVDANPVFTNFPLQGGALSYSHDFTLLPGSPAIGAGTDGTDIGILGGMLPFDVGANPYFPQMMEVSLPSGSSVPAGGTLNVHFKARKQD